MGVQGRDTGDRSKTYFHRWTFLTDYITHRAQVSPRKKRGVFHRRLSFSLFSVLHCGRCGRAGQGRNGDKLIYTVTSLSIMVHTVRKRESNDTDLAVPGGARPPCCCCNFPFSGTTAVVQQTLSAGGQVEHRTLSLGHKCMAVKLRGSSSALSLPPSTLLPTSWRD